MLAQVGVLIFSFLSQKVSQGVKENQLRKENRKKLQSILSNTLEHSDNLHKKGTL